MKLCPKEGVTLGGNAIQSWRAPPKQGSKPGTKQGFKQASLSRASNSYKRRRCRS